MNLSPIKNAVTSRLSRQVLTVKKHSPAILFGVGAAGMITSTVLACRATLKLESLLSEAESKKNDILLFDHPNYTEKDASRDLFVLKVQTAKNIGKLYAPAVIVGFGSAAALTGSHVIMSRRNAAVMAAYAALDKGFNEYRDRVREELGGDKDLEFRHGSIKSTEKVVDADGNVTEIERSVPAHPDSPSIYARYFDELSSSWERVQEYNLIFLNAQQSYQNQMLQMRGHVLLNDVYDGLGLSRSAAGAVVGWVKDGDGDGYVDFGIYRGDERSRAFVNGPENSILLDFNVDGIVYDQI